MSPDKVKKDPTMTIVISAENANQRYWSDIWSYRELFIILAWRDVAVRYKQTVLGVAWAVIRPLITMIIFTAIFGRLAQLPSEGSAPYELMVLAGMLPWFLFASILSDCSSSLITNGPLIGKVYFPRLIIPASAAIVSVIDFLFTFALFLLVSLWFASLPSSRILFLPIFIVFAVAAALGPALAFAALNVKYRDFRYIVPFVVQFGLYVSPVGFSSSVIPEKWRFIFYLNPVASIIDGFRWCLLSEGDPIYWRGIFLSFGVVIILLWCGLVIFRSTERSFADII